MLILASSSPRRHELLLAAGLEHSIRSPDIAEHQQIGESPQDFVQRLAKEKANAVACQKGDVVLAADTIVCLRGEVLGKPADREDAARMLRRLSGETHLVLTGICIRAYGVGDPSGSRQIIDLAQTEVSFCKISESEIDEYVLSGEPLDKAGAYAIQGLASKFIESIRGSYHNVVGLPISLVYRHLKAI